jgi:hypothetical protein
MRTKWLQRALVGFTWLAFGLRAWADTGATWQTFTDSKGRFSLLMPGKPQYQITETPAQDGSVLVHTDMYLANASEALYVAGATTYSADINTELAFTKDRDNFDQDVEDKLTSQQRLKFQNHPAMKSKWFNARANCYFSVLSVVVGHHSYLVAARYYTANEPANVTRYFQSYKLISP